MLKVATLVIAILFLSNFDVGRSSQSSTTTADDLWLSPVNTGDCVAARISAPKTTFVAALDEKYCTENNPDETKAKKCIENSRAQNEFSFFTDRCSEKQYFIGIKGKEIRLRRISKAPGKPHDFIGSFSGAGFTVKISNPRRVGNITVERDGGSDDEIRGGTYEVDITVNNGTTRKTFRGILSYGL